MFSQMVKTLYRSCELGTLPRGDRSHSDRSRAALDSLARTVSTLLRPSGAAARLADVRARTRHRIYPTRGGGTTPTDGPFRCRGHSRNLHPERFPSGNFSILEGIHLTTARRGWRSGLELVLFVSTLVLGVSFSMLTHAAPSGPVVPIGRASAIHLLTATDAADACQWTTGRDAPPPDSSDEDDDNDDGDDACALPAVASPVPPGDRTVNWLLIRPVFENLSTRAAGSHSLPAPPQ